MGEPRDVQTPRPPRKKGGVKCTEAFQITFIRLRVGLPVSTGTGMRYSSILFFQIWHPRFFGLLSLLPQNHFYDEPNQSSSISTLDQTYVFP